MAKPKRRMPRSWPRTTRRWTSVMSPEEIAALCQDSALTQAQIAEQMGVSPNTLSRWKRGALRISEPEARLLKIVCAHAKKRRDSP